MRARVICNQRGAHAFDIGDVVVLEDDDGTDRKGWIRESDQLEQRVYDCDLGLVRETA